MSNGNYSIYVDDKPIYVAGHPTACVTGATIDEKLNDAGQLVFTVPCNNPHYDLISERKKVVVYQGINPIWRGFVVSYSKNFRKDLKVTCVGELSYLNDTIQPQARYQGKTPKQLLKAYLDIHNSQSSEKFLLGRVTVTDPNDSVYRYTNYESTLTVLRDDLCDSLEGYLRIRWVGNKRYLDLVTISDYGSLCGQYIEFGKNLLDYAEGVTASDIATACLPLGAKLSTQEINGLDAYTTIKSVNNDKDYIQNDTAVANYGMIKQVVKFDNVTEPSNLKTKAQAWLSTNQYANISLDISALDLSVLNVYVTPKKWIDLALSADDWDDFGSNAWEDLGTADWDGYTEGQDWTILDGKKFTDLNETTGNIDEFKLGDTVVCFAIPYGMTATFPIYNKTTYLQDPTSTKITLSSTSQKTFTEMATKSERIQATASETTQAEMTETMIESGYNFAVNKITKTSALISCNIKVTGTLTSGAICVLPEGYRPTSAITCVGIVDSASGIVSIATNGEISISSSASSVELNLTFNLE